MSAPTLLIPEGNVNTHIGIGYNATGVVASRLEFPGGSIYLSSNLNSNIGMPLTSSEYPKTNTSGSYNYQPIEIVRPTLETIGGVESIINTTLLYYFKEDYGSVYEKNTYFIAFKFLSKSHNRRLLTHTTFL